MNCIEKIWSEEEGINRLCGAEMVLVGEVPNGLQEEIVDEQGITIGYRSGRFSFYQCPSCKTIKII